MCRLEKQSNDTTARAPRTPHPLRLTYPWSILPSASIAIATTITTMRRSYSTATRTSSAAAAAAAAALLLLLASYTTTVSAMSRAEAEARGAAAVAAAAADDAAAAAAGTPAANAPGVATDSDTTSAMWPEAMPGRVDHYERYRLAYCSSTASRTISCSTRQLVRDRDRDRDRHVTTSR